MDKIGVVICAGENGFPDLGAWKLRRMGMNARAVRLYMNQYNVQPPSIFVRLLRGVRAKNPEIRQKLNLTVLFKEIDSAIAAVDLVWRLKDAGPVIPNAQELALRAQNKEKLFFIGEGLGGELLLRYCGQMPYGEQISGVIAFSPSLSDDVGVSKIFSNIPICLIFAKGDSEDIARAQECANALANLSVQVFPRSGLVQLPWEDIFFEESGAFMIDKLREWSTEKA